MLQRFFGSPKRTEGTGSRGGHAVKGGGGASNEPPEDPNAPVDFEKVARDNAHSVKIIRVLEKDRDEARREAIGYKKQGQKGAARAKTALFLERKAKIDHVVESQARVAHEIDNFRTAEIVKYQLGSLTEVLKLIKGVIDMDALDNAHDVQAELRQTEAEVGQLNKVLSRPPRGMFGRIDDEELERELEKMGLELSEGETEEFTTELAHQPGPPAASVLVLDNQGEPMRTPQADTGEW